ncbi:hypothetical protein [Cupriavidus sp. AU9028]|uniref:hypothetical protein n=1 Tax=Cupriavidus sp. AU9028 TaxID=2871157 RepID=UPI001C97617C|nr:hypothetical protein [Cupriavidus sp. AU9028]MBY4897182.1 hypothetical protein [Cupriavidus sp. AU9028]
MQNALRGVSLMEEIQQNALQLQLNAISRALGNSQDAMNEVGKASGWTELGLLPSMVLRQTMEQNTDLIQGCLKLIADAQAACLSQARDASESLQRCQADALASSAAAGAQFPAQAMFAQASDAGQAMAAGARSASMHAQAAMQGASRGGRRTDHAS